MHEHSVKKRAGWPVSILLSVLLMVLASTLVAAERDSTGPSERTWPSVGGAFRVGYRSELAPIVINRIHHWVLHVETSAGQALTDAQLSVSGGMPAHNHGMPTSPRMTQNLGNGDYLLEGMRFHMMGHWEIKVGIEADGISDVVTIPLDL
ncbi:MAG: FixH family protein [Pseudomonadales bacterium]|nr:FixH family protein [Pseudomonadales bacterium]